MVSGQRASSLSLGRRISIALQSLFRPGDLSVLIITLGLVIIPALALFAADWPLDPAVVLPVNVLSVLIGFVLARSRYNELAALIISACYSVSLTFLLASLTQPEGGVVVLSRTVQWLSDAVSGGINQDELVFTLLVSTLFWFLGYNAAWHVFRIDRVWRVVLPPGIIMASNTVFYSGENNLDGYMIVYTFLGLLLFAHSHLDAREWDWYSNGVRVPRKLRGQFLRVGAMLAFVAVALAWVVPSGGLQEQLNRFQEFLRSDPLVEFSEFWNRLFATIDVEGPTSADYYGGDNLRLGGAVQLGDQIILEVSAPNDRRYYWKSRVFDTYENGEWSSGASIRLTTNASTLDIRLEDDLARETVEQRFTIGARSSRLVYAAPQPTRIDLPTRTYMSWIYPEQDNGPMNVSAIRPIQVLQRGESYTASSRMTVATADQLRATGTDYPAWIIDHPQYLRTSANVVSPRTTELAAQIVAAAGAETQYDKAKAIETWLRRNITYNEQIPPPPLGVENVIDWFLFDLRQGYCNYYATAMIVMLRTQGIPARLAAGFAEGDWDADLGAYVVRERDAHTWVEAYFPGYGWIEFDPTAAQAPLTREGDDEISDDSFQPDSNEPTATFTPTPTPTIPPATPTVEPSPENPQVQPPDVQETPTPTPTFTPSPTVTPIVIPTEPPSVEPPPPDPLSAILPALGILLLTLIVMIVLIAIAIFLYWWWEWRGMGGLSPISRAYARLERYLGLIGVRFNPQQTPEERRRQTMREIPGAERPVTAITRLYTTERYGRRPSTEQEQQRIDDTADEAWQETRTRILSRYFRKFQFWKRN